MEKQIGLWIDHKRAVIVVLEGKKQVVRQIFSNLEKHTRFRGGARAKAAYSPQFFTGETQVDRRFQKHLNKYYQEVITAIKGASSLFVFGCGEAKYEFEKQLANEKKQGLEITVEPADKMTDREIAAKVRKYYAA